MKAWSLQAKAWSLQAKARQSGLFRWLIDGIYNILSLGCNFNEKCCKLKER